MSDHLPAVCCRGHAGLSCGHSLHAFRSRRPVAARLDPERLARALFEAERPGDWPTWTDYLGAFGSPGIAPWRRKADRIAAEYDALAAKEAE
jgi:hypothetical protein